MNVTKYDRLNQPKQWASDVPEWAHSFKIQLTGDQLFSTEHAFHFALDGSESEEQLGQFFEGRGEVGGFWVLMAPAEPLDVGVDEKGAWVASTSYDPRRWWTAAHWAFFEDGTPFVDCLLLITGPDFVDEVVTSHLESLCTEGTTFDNLINGREDEDTEAMEEDLYDDEFNSGDMIEGMVEGQLDWNELHGGLTE